MQYNLKSRAGFTIVEALLFLVVACFCIFTTWFVIKSQKTESSSPASDSTSSVSPAKPVTKIAAIPAWDVTVQPPTYWDRFYNPAEKFQISYPPDWTQSVSTDKSSTYFRSDKNIMYYSTQFNVPQSQKTDYGPYYYTLEVTNQSLSNALDSDEQALVYKNQGPGSAVSPKIDGTKYYTFKGHSAVLLNTQIKDTNTGIVRFDQNLIISANGNAYDFGSQTVGKFGPFDNINVKGALSSLMLQ